MAKTGKPTKKDLRIELERQRNEWNEVHGVGTPIRTRDGLRSRTRSQAWIVSGASIMVMIEDAPGIVPLDEIVLDTPAATGASGS